jgi:hypothetical protein
VLDVASTSTWRRERGRSRSASDRPCDETCRQRQQGGRRDAAEPHRPTRARPVCGQPGCERSRVDHSPRHTAGYDAQRRIVAHHEARRRELVRIAQPVEIDAARGAACRVERVDERRVAGTLVERVRPAAVRARRPRQRPASHDLVRLARIDDRLRREPAGSRVECPHLVLQRVGRRGVVDQVHRAAVGRDGVEAEVPRERDPRDDVEPRRVDDDERCDRPRKRRAGGDQDERVAVAGEAAGRPVVGDRRDRELSAQKPREEHLARSALDPSDERPAADAAKGHVAWGARDCDSRAAHVDSEDRKAVGVRGSSRDAGRHGDDAEGGAHAPRYDPNAARGPFSAARARPRRSRPRARSRASRTRGSPPRCRPAR